ncbi:hypothetical protein [Nocardioides sp.]|uniref:hypothetical protein n=1 Tax=Nocardioides sp. TaxID=35761 RepID=UPI003515C6DF
MSALDLPDTDDPGTAGEVYLLGLEPRRRGRVRQVVYSVLDLWCAMVGGTMELTRGIDVVLRHREDGALALIIPADDPEEAAFTLEHVREQLATLSPAEFRATWSMD